MKCYELCEYFYQLIICDGGYEFIYTYTFMYIHMYIYIYIHVHI
jgi:hypothetical protein